MNRTLRHVSPVRSFDKTMNHISRLKSGTGMLALGLFFAGNGLAVEGSYEHLTLQGAITRALENNHEIAIQRLNPKIQKERLNMAKQAFDVKLESSYTYQSIDTPQNAQEFVATGGGTASSTAAGAGADGTTSPVGPVLLAPNIFEERNHVGKVSLIKRFGTGTSIELGTSLRVLDNSLNRQLPPAIFHPEYETYTGVTLTQPLLKDGGLSANLAEIRIAKSNGKLADLEWQSRTAGLVGEVMKRYYDVIFAYENMGIQKDAIGLAEKLLDDNRKKGKEGVVAPNDINVSEAAVYVRQEESIIAETQYMERQNALQLLFKTVAEMDRVVSIRPLDQLSGSISVPQRPELLAQAWKSRYDILQASEVVTQRQYQTAYAKNQVKPRLDLIGSVGVHALDGSVGESYNRAGEGQGPEWAVGVNFSVPFSFGKQKAQSRLAEHEEVQAEIDVERVKVQVSLEIDTVLSRLNADQQRVTTARKSREVALKTLEAETKRFQEGVSTSYQVLEYQKEYSQTRSREVAALADLNKDLVDLWLTTSQLLERRGIVVADNAGGDKKPNGN